MRSKQVTQYEFSNLPISIEMGNVLRRVESSLPRLDLVVTATGSDSYRFGFNGKENDDELKGEGNSLDFGAWIYDSRLGRWLSLDPQAEKYPNKSAYCSFANNPNYFIDPSGEIINPFTSKGLFTYFWNMMGTHETRSILWRQLVCREIISIMLVDGLFVTPDPQGGPSWVTVGYHLPTVKVREGVKRKGRVWETTRVVKSTTYNSKAYFKLKDESEKRTGMDFYSQTEVQQNTEFLNSFIEKPVKFYNMTPTNAQLFTPADEKAASIVQAIGFLVNFGTNIRPVNFETKSEFIQRLGTHEGEHRRNYQGLINTNSTSSSSEQMSRDAEGRCVGEQNNKRN